jgi:hypothetical protein
MTDRAVYTTERCPNCGALLALVGRTHLCRRAMQSDGEAVHRSSRPEPVPSQSTDRTAAKRQRAYRARRRAAARRRTPKAADDVDAKGSRPSIGKPAMCHARKERVLLVGTDQWITSGPAATAAALKGRIHGCTRIVSRKVRFFSLAPRAPSIHGTSRT